LFAVSSPIYWGQTPGGDAPRALRAYDCATGHVGSAAFQQCWCGGGK
jgi:hypothetical protein